MLLIGIVGEERKFKGSVEKRVVFDENEMKRRIFGEEMEIYRIEEMEVKETEDGEFQKVEENSLEKVEKMENLFAVKVRFVEKTQELSKGSELDEQVSEIVQNDSEKKVKEEFNSNVEKAKKQVEELLKEIADKTFDKSDLKECIIVDFEKPDDVDGEKERIDKNFVSELEKDLKKIFDSQISVVKESVSEFVLRKKTENETPKIPALCILVCSSRSAFDILFHELLKISQDCFEYTFAVLSPEVSTSPQEVEHQINTFKDARFLERISKDMGMLEVENIKKRENEWGFKAVHLCEDPNRTVFFKLALCQFREFLIERQKKVEEMKKREEEEKIEKEKKKKEEEEEKVKKTENQKLEEREKEESGRTNFVCSICGGGTSIMKEEIEKLMKSQNQKLFINRIVGGTTTAGFGFVFILSSFLLFLNPIIALPVLGGSLILTCTAAGATGLFEIKNRIDMRKLKCKFLCEKCAHNPKNDNSLKQKNNISP